MGRTLPASQTIPKFRRPVELIYLEEVSDRPTAQRREYSIKKLTRQKKISLVRDYKENSQVQ